MTGNKQYVFLCKLRYAAVTVFLAALMAFPAYGYYDGSAGELRNDFSIKGSGYSIRYMLNGGEWAQGNMHYVKYVTRNGTNLPGVKEIGYAGYEFYAWFKASVFTGWAVS